MAAPQVWLAWLLMKLDEFGQVQVGVASLAAFATTALWYYLWVGRGQRRKAEELRVELEAAMLRVEELEDKLEELELEEERKRREALEQAAAAAASPAASTSTTSATSISPKVPLGLGKKPKEVRIWMDGAFDVFHFGHMNAFRQGRALGTYLVVGVNDDASITACKGTAPVLNDEERIGAVMGCRWVDEVVPHCPYVMSPEYLSFVIDKYQID